MVEDRCQNVNKTITNGHSRYNTLHLTGASTIQTINTSEPDMGKNIFEILIFISRPAAGKSEIVDYLAHIPIQTRHTRFHIGEFDPMDDFPMLWTWFDEDHILSELGHPRIHTNEHNYFYWDYLWDVLIHRLCLEYQKKVRDKPDYHDTRTAVIEFSRGVQQGGFQRAFEHLSKQVVERATVMYVNVSWEESLRKNRARFNPDRPDSILGHSLSDEKMERLYKDNDWEEVSAGDPHFLTIQGLKVPYVVFENEDDVTTAREEELGQRLEETLGKLWKIYTSRK
jgi:hypothetical protein